MDHSLIDDKENYTFDPFARHAFYHAINQSLVRTAVERFVASQPDQRHLRVVELASGTGLVTEIILQEFAHQGRSVGMTCIEPSSEARTLARERLHEREVQFVDGDAAHLAQFVQNVDLVFCCNAIHLLPQQPEVVAQVAASLAPGRFFACNTAFFDGATPPGAESYSFLLVRRAIGWLRQHHPTVRPSRRGQTPSVAWHTAAEYVALCEGAGLHIVDQTLEEAQMSIQAVQDIGSYWLFIEGALPGVPTALGAEALQHAAVEAADELQMTSVPRIWLQLIAQR
jgi:ubiquinone/menaquinone biosynthesis C-methylase UbiE